MTLVGLADISGVSVTTISRAERGELTLSYDKFSALARALNIDIGALFSGAESHVDRVNQPLLTRDGNGVVYEGPSMSYEFLANDASGKRMNPIRGFIRAREVHGYTKHPGEEFIFILSGTVRVFFEDGRSFDLKRGDTLYFSSSIGHAYVTTGPGPAEFISACTAEDQHIYEAHDLKMSKQPRSKSSPKK
jgi:quercetin dioxygenase-like cupin family protein